MQHIHTRTITDLRPGLTRSRWAAIGAAVAVTLGAGGLGIAQATVDSGDKPVFIAIEPCRLADTRPDFQVGDRATPLNADETYTIVGTGAQGNCNVPADVSSLAMNVTALDATAPTFLRFAPGTTVPAGEGSSLNPVPGQPPTPNAVTSSIDDSGQFSVYNLAGNVDMIIDVVGYYDDHTHDDRYFTETEVNGALAANRPRAGFDGGAHPFLFNVTDAPEAIRTVEMTTTTRGRFIATAEVMAVNVLAASKQLTCSITLDGLARNDSNFMWVDLEQNVNNTFSMSGQFGGVAAGEHDVHLTCYNDDGADNLFPLRSMLSVEWIPEPITLVIPDIEFPVLGP